VRRFCSPAQCGRRTACGDPAAQPSVGGAPRAAILALVAVVAAGCRTPVPVTALPQADDDYFSTCYWDNSWMQSEDRDLPRVATVRREAAVWGLRFLMAKRRAFGGDSGREAAFVAVADRFYPDYYQSPPAEAVSHLRARGWDVMPYSEAELICEEVVVPPGSDFSADEDAVVDELGGIVRLPKGYRDPKTGKPGAIYYVEVKAVLSDTAVWIEAAVTRGPLSGGGGEFLIEKRDGVWKIKKVLSEWVS